MSMAVPMDFSVIDVKMELESLNCPHLSLIDDYFQHLDIASASGRIVSFMNDLVPLPFLELKANIVAQQDLHGYDHPWVGGAGKNLIPYPYSSGDNVTINGITFTVSPDGVVTVNGTASANAEFTLVNNGKLPAGTYTLSGLPSGGGSSTFVFNAYAFDENHTALFDFRTGVARTVTVESDIDILVIGIRIISGYTANNLVIKPQFEKGSTATDFAPYSNICPISGWTGANIYDDPKYGGLINWNQLASLDSSKWSLYRIDFTASGNEIKFQPNSSSTSTLKTARCAILKNHKILVLGTWKHNESNYGFTYGLYRDTSSNTYDDRISLSYSSSSEDIPIDTILNGGNNSNYFGISFATSANTSNYSTIKNLQVFDITTMFGEEKANEIYAMEQSVAGSGVAYFKSIFPHDYYDYNTGVSNTMAGIVNGENYHTYSVNWQTEAGTVYGGTLDVKTGVLTLTHKYTELGDKNWYYNSVNSQFHFLLLDVKSGIPQTGAVPFICSDYAPAPHPAAAQVTNGTIGTGTSAGLSNKTIIVMDTRYSDVASFTAALTANNAHLVYELDTPQTVQLTAQQVKMLVGRNNIWTDIDIVEVTYYTTESGGMLGLSLGRSVDPQEVSRPDIDRLDGLTLEREPLVLEPIDETREPIEEEQAEEEPIEVEEEPSEETEETEEE